MEEKTNPVKEFLFNHIKKSEKKYHKLFSETKLEEIINDILKNCFSKISSTKDKEEKIATLATGILHYMLTNSLITSQRKIIHKDIEMDIVIPDLKTLENDPKRTLIIYISNTLDKTKIKEKLIQLQKIQPETKNIWIVLAKNLGFKNTYVIQQNNSNFSKIIFDIGQFVNVQGQNKLKILRA